MSEEESDGITVEIFETAGRYAWRVLMNREEVASSITPYETPEEALGALTWLRDNAANLTLPAGFPDD